MFATCTLIFPFPWRTARAGAGGRNHCFSGPFCHLASHLAALALHILCPSVTTLFDHASTSRSCPYPLCLECSFSGHLPGPLLLDFCLVARATPHALFPAQLPSPGSIVTSDLPGSVLFLPTRTEVPGGRALALFPQVWELPD